MIKKHADRQNVYEAIEGEREYQEEQWPRKIPLPITGEIILLEDYIRRFKKHYQEEENDYDFDVPIKCLDDLRKMAAILVRAMENRVVYREQKKHGE